MFPSNLLPSTYSRDPVNNSPKQAFILKTLSGPNPFSPLQSDCCVHYMIIARAVFQPTLAMATQTGFRLRCSQDNAAHLALSERMCQASEHQALALPACLRQIATLTQWLHSPARSQHILQRAKDFFSPRDNK